VNGLVVGLRIKR